MELIGRILDGSIPQDLKDALRRAEPSGPRVSHDEKIRHLEEIPLLAVVGPLRAHIASRLAPRGRAPSEFARVRA